MAMAVYIYTLALNLMSQRSCSKLTCCLTGQGMEEKGGFCVHREEASCRPFGLCHSLFSQSALGSSSLL